MGDRTRVTLTFLASQKEKLDSLLGEWEQPNSTDQDIDGGGVVDYIYDEVNYGTLDFLARIRDAGIAYNSRWEDGGEYTKGTEYCRFTEDGDCIQQEIYDEDINPQLDSLMKLIDNPVQLRRFIVNHKRNVTFDELDENQVEYGKRYMTAKLIAPT